MLHALLHRKLDPAIPEPKRLEDVVTSTVFGTLLIAGADDVLMEWLATAIGPDATPICGEWCGCWFWPRLTHAEPDVVLAIAHHVVVVEAKVRSGRNDLSETGELGEDEDSPVHDQLCRQWASIALAAEAPGLPIGLAAAVQRARPHLLYLVDARRAAKARRELDESQSLLPVDADARLLTWQALHQVLHRKLRTGGVSTPRWIGDLIAYLELEGLAGFVGFTQMDALTHVRSARWMHELTLVRGADVLRWNAFRQQLIATAVSPIFTWSCRDAHQSDWGLLRKEADAAELACAAALVRTARMAVRPSPHSQTTHRGTLA